MSSERRLVSFDWVMKQLLRNKADFVIFEGFLSELLHDDIKIKHLLESKSNRVDILVENSREELIIIEVQRETEYDYLQRILFGASKLLLEYMEKGMPYSKIRKIISISLVYFDLGQGEDYAYQGRTEFIGLNKKDILKLNSAQQELYKTEKIADIYPEYYILKINQFDDIARNTIDEWIYFLKNERIKDNFTARGLKEAKEKLDIMKLSDEERREYEAYLESLHYQASMYESSYKLGEIRGKKEGIEVGAKDKAIEMAKKLKEKGIDIAVISETSGLPAAEIAGL